MGKGSFEKINYSLRPAKSVERKMLSFALQKLNNFDTLSEYQYVGFGSTFFQDHILFHKDLGINSLISIEKSGKKERFNFNKPFHCIDILFGQSTDILPKVNWNQKSILWLDYDQTIRSEYLSDVRTFFSSAESASVFLISVNANPDSYGASNKERKECLVDKLGNDKIPYKSKPIDFANNNFHGVLKKIIDNEIKSTLLNRNGALSEENQFEYKPIFNFKYADGAPMITVGGVLIKKSQEELFDKSNFKELSFVKTDDAFFEIEVPSLTLKEIKFLNSQLPSGIDKDGNYIEPDIIEMDPLIPKSDIVKYSRIYSYFPIYAESLAL